MRFTRTGLIFPTVSDEEKSFITLTPGRKNLRRFVDEQRRRQKVRHRVVERRNFASTRFVPDSRFSSLGGTDPAQHLRHLHLPDSVEPMADYSGARTRTEIY